MSSALTKKQQAELDRLQEQHRLLKPQTVVDFARDPNTALHSRFTWDDSAAAERYRLWEARQVIRVAVFTPKGSQEKVRAFVSLRADRGEGGYRATVDVLSDAELRAKMLEEALDELQIFERKYRILSELSPVFAAASRVREQKAQAQPGSNRKPKSRTRNTRRKAAAVPA